MELHESKAAIYETWAIIDRAFEQIISGLAKLEKLAVLDSDFAQDQHTITNDLWAKTNIQIMTDVRRREEDDRTHYGRCGPRLRDELEDGNDNIDLKRVSKCFRG
jgi:hypothetical protein